MKTIKQISVLLCCMLLLLVMGCKKLLDKSEMTVGMTSAPTDKFNEVNIELTDVQVKYADSNVGDDGWITLNTKTGTYNLVDYSTGTTVDIATEDKIAIGEIVMIRIRLADNSSLITSAGVRAPLHMPDSFREGVYINLNTTLKYNEHIKIVLDFNADDSVVLESDGTYTLSPKVTVKSIIQV